MNVSSILRLCNQQILNVKVKAIDKIFYTEPISILTGKILPISESGLLLGK